MPSSIPFLLFYLIFFSKKRPLSEKTAQNTLTSDAFCYKII